MLICLNGPQEISWTSFHMNACLHDAIKQIIVKDTAKDSSLISHIAVVLGTVNL